MAERKSQKPASQVIYPIAFFAICGLIGIKAWRIIPKTTDLHQWMKSIAIYFVTFLLFAPSIAVHYLKKHYGRKGGVTYTRWYHRLLLDIDYDILLLFLIAVTSIGLFVAGVLTIKRLSY